ncbi:MAG: NYN domain-containing protein [Candidatus Heimdallarchaeota archaeon]|nr:MAG: NYN domain-containing protein [Candidatus Heimdallarchaeota archaeon]
MILIFMISNCICPYCGKEHPYQEIKPVMRKNSRVALFIDGGNLYHAAKKLGFKIDYLRLKEYFTNEMKLYKAFYYSAYDSTEGFIMKILDWLRHNGFTVRSKEVKKISHSYVKGNMDVELTVDMLLNIDHYDIAILFSGDSDFTRCVTELQKRNKKVHVVSTENSDPPILAHELKAQADESIELTDIIPMINQKSG